MAENKCTVVKFKGYLKFIDLGLPSGTKWAAYNVGATSPYEAGDYFSWGNIEGHAAGDGYSFDQTNYDASAGAALTGDIPANTTYDAARANFGGNAKMPTETQIYELVNNCTSEWTTINGVSGRKFISLINGKSIFIPACGYIEGTTPASQNVYGFYWSATFTSNKKPDCFYFSNNGLYPHFEGDRVAGVCVRAVRQDNI